MNEDNNNYLKTWKFPNDPILKGQKITLSNLLNHTAGLSVSDIMGYENTENLPTTQQILNGESPANSKPVRSIFEPNLKYEYSGDGTTLSKLRQRRFCVLLHWKSPKWQCYCGDDKRHEWTIN